MESGSGVNPLYFLLGLFLGATGISALWWWRSRKDVPSHSGLKRPEPDTRSFLKIQIEEGMNSHTPSPIRTESVEKGHALRALDEELDIAMQNTLVVLKEAFPQTHTTGIFFPGRDEGWYLRTWLSEADSLIPGVTLTSQRGLVGRLMKEDIPRVFEGDLPSDSTQLHYYEKNEGVRSLIAVPILVAGTRRGALFLDSLKGQAFNAKDLEKIDGLAQGIGIMAYYAYLAYEYNQHRDQLRYFSRYQRRFLENMTLNDIVSVLVEFMRDSFDGDRFYVLGREKPDSDLAEVLAAEGLDCERLLGFRFLLSEGGLVRLVFDKEQVVNRTLKVNETLFRMSKKEPYNPSLQSLLMVPVPTDHGVDMALGVESTQSTRFPEPYQNLLNTIARAAGLALSRARLYHEKEELAIRDGLTGILNHRAFQERLRDEILRAQRNNGRLALLLLDIDFFKRVNDTYGHPVGDLVLKEAAQILSQNVRAGVDVVARYGGEEFVCMLPESDLRSAMDTAERIRQTMEAKEFDLGNVRFHVTVSIGGTLFPVDSRHAKDLLEKADKAMYKAKESGRNQVIFYH